ncbi:hypothetical protein [Streptomyces sp. NPDC091209]|uniref:hypothetical protein n=1 Tax=Streptomyces sp. NPDC091209 TaxID=3365974 RepID=UPI0037FB2F20
MASAPAMAPESAPAPMSAEPVASESAETAGPGGQIDAPSGPRARRRGRTTLLIATAAVLGLVAGTCTGFLVQADREPAELPSLSQPVVTQAKGDGPEPLSAAQDHRVKTDGDLRKLLLPRPKGTKVPDWAPEGAHWLDLAGYADSLDNADQEFGSLVGSEFRRGAEVDWMVGSTDSTEIRLVQYRQEEKLGAADRAGGWNVDDTTSWAIPGVNEGMVYLYKVERKAGYLPMYKALASASRGDIAMEIWVYDSKPIPKSKIMDLAKRQMERL